MEIPLQLTLRDVPSGRHRELEERVRLRAARLERYCDSITGCRVAIERPHQHEQSGNPFRVRIDVTVPPGHEIVVRKEPGDFDLHTDLVTVINAAFEAVERQLVEVVERRRGEVKSRDEARGLVVRLFREGGYGFLKTPDGRDVYFHEHAVLGGDFARLEPGTEVRFSEEMGERGPQASTVQVVAKHGATVGRVAERMVEEPLGWEERVR